MKKRREKLDKREQKEGEWRKGNRKGTWKATGDGKGQGNDEGSETERGSTNTVRVDAHMV